MILKQRKSKIIKIGRLHIGGGNPIAIQSMAKSKTSDIDKTVKQIKELQTSGCEIVRVAVKDTADAKAIKLIKQNIEIPLVADIHFDWRLALEAVDNGVDKIRLNPGNIYKEGHIREVVSALKSAKIPLRIGVNSGSVKKINGRKLSVADSLVLNSLSYIKVIERMKFYDIVVSLKAADVLETIKAYRKMAELCDYPLHLGVTATGFPLQGAIKSSIAIGALLLEGIGDTIRISLTDSPSEEVKVARIILEALNMRHFGPEIISCPTCGRCEVDLIKIVKELEKKLYTLHFTLYTPPLKVAVMGCVVNGPGEAREADIGIAFGKGNGILFKKGRAVKKVSYKDCKSILLREIEAISNKPKGS